MPPRKKIVVCAGCNMEKPHYARGYCEPCYARKLRAEKKAQELPAEPVKEGFTVERWLTN